MTCLTNINSTYDSSDIPGISWQGHKKTLQIPLGLLKHSLWDFPSQDWAATLWEASTQPLVTRQRHLEYWAWPSLQIATVPDVCLEPQERLREELPRWAQATHRIMKEWQIITLVIVCVCVCDAKYSELWRKTRVWSLILLLWLLVSYFMSQRCQSFHLKK